MKSLAATFALATFLSCASATSADEPDAVTRLPAQPAGPTAVKPAVPALPSMTFAEIERALRDRPPAWEHGDVRASIAAALDQHRSMPLFWGESFLVTRDLVAR